MNVFLILMIFSLSFFSSFAQQPIFIGGMSGNTYGQVQAIFSKDINEAIGLGIFVQSAFQFEWKMPADYRAGCQYQLTYKITETLQPGAGINIQPMTGPRPSISLTGSKKTKSGRLVIQPNIQIWKETIYELFAFYEFSPVNEKRVNPYFRLQCITGWTHNGHNRSYQFVNAGVSLGNLRVGAAAHFDQFGHSSSSRRTTNYGIFFNYLIF